MAAIAADVDIERSLRSSATGTTRSARTAPAACRSSTSSQSDAAEAMWAAATSVGFFTVTNHGVPDELIESRSPRPNNSSRGTLTPSSARAPSRRSSTAASSTFSQIRPSTGTADQRRVCRSRRARAPWTAAGRRSRRLAAGRAGDDGGVASAAARILDMLEPCACPNLDRALTKVAHALGPASARRACTTLRLLHYPRRAAHGLVLRTAAARPRAASGNFTVAAERGVASLRDAAVPVARPRGPRVRREPAGRRRPERVASGSPAASVSRAACGNEHRMISMLP